MTIREMWTRFWQEDKPKGPVKTERFEVTFRLPGMSRTYRNFVTFDAARDFAVAERERLLGSRLKDLLFAPEFGEIERQVAKVSPLKELEDAPGAQIYTNVFVIFGGTRISLGMYDSVEDADRMADSDYYALLGYNVEWYVEVYWGTKLVPVIRRLTDEI